MRNSQMKLKRAMKILISTFLMFILLLLLITGWLRLSISKEDVQFKSGNLLLRGTLLTPKYKGKTPGIVFVNGSGQTSRKSMLLFAWIFASKGYSALAYDKRGVGQSEGGSNEWEEFSFYNLAQDASSGYKFLQSHFLLMTHIENGNEQCWILIHNHC